MRILILFFILFAITLTSRAQELDCAVIVNADRVATSDRTIFKDMEISFSQFLNDRKWTDDVFSPEEKIRCQMIIGIDAMPNIGNFTATVQIQSIRPVFNTNMETRLLALTQNYADGDWNFQYTESQPLEFNENNFTSNLTSILAYYAYVIIGLDYDSFAPLGGTPYFEKAMVIASNAQQSQNPGWQQFVNPQRNRYWLIENLMSQQMRPVREGIYEYHRIGLDKFLSSPEESRKAVLEVLKKLQSVNKIRPNSFLITLFLYSKSNELINIFSQGEPGIRNEAFSILQELDPTKTDKYQAILSN
ncbi:MAG: DUF4835 family protein [Candidatus Cyclobacteriaceae bacterium M3_2C_046]